MTRTVKEPVSSSILPMSPSLSTATQPGEGERLVSQFVLEAPSMQKETTKTKPIRACLAIFASHSASLADRIHSSASLLAHIWVHMLAASEAAERGRTERRTSCLAGQMLSLRARLVFLSGLVMIPSSVAWITGPANYNYSFNIQGAKTRQFSLGNNNESAFAFSIPAPAWQGETGMESRWEGWWTWWKWSLHDGLDCLGDGARSFNHSSFQSPPS
ncbi:hypothetical protein TEQG_07791 [Trichophyton equinum CBS 127.97]|uniref:Uncharacterized protein n=1 Tax=Trichophyton equinum (strain ATCC MYA-4606 / CBS 127.97) TaxID=559882 RepID=F2Q416_TRIEC|nr:hypothetical protein TEQG_07791 [Trichophyton equinum CBS 127.97]